MAAASADRRSHFDHQSDPGLRGIGATATEAFAGVMLTALSIARRSDGKCVVHCVIDV